MPDSEPNLPRGESKPPEQDAPNAGAELSPSVRRLVRQYDLDITGLHGSGPGGRVRVGDVMAMIGGRQLDPEPPDDGTPAPARRGGEALESARDTAWSEAASTRVSLTAPATSVFECNMSRVLKDRKRLSLQGISARLPAYYAIACRDALTAVPEVAASEQIPVEIGFVELTADHGQLCWVATLDRETQFEQVNAVALAAGHGGNPGLDAAGLERCGLVFYVLRAAGNLLTLPTPIAGEHHASLCVGGIRRVVAVINGEDAPRIVAQCNVSLSFRPEAVSIARAQRFVGEFVRALESYSTAAIASAT